MYLIPANRSQAILEFDASFKETVIELYQTVECNFCGTVYSNPVGVENAVVFVDYEALKTLKNILAKDGATQKVLDAIIHFMESSTSKGNQCFLIVQC